MNVPDRLRTAVRNLAIGFFLFLVTVVPAALADGTPAPSIFRDAIEHARCGPQLYPIREWISAVESNRVLSEHAKTIESLLLGEKTISGPEAQAEIVSLLKDLRDSDQLKPGLARALDEAKKDPRFPKLPPGKEAEAIDQFCLYVDAELTARGFSRDGTIAAFKPWDQLAKEQAALIRSSGTSAVTDPGFQTEFEKLLHTTFSDGNEIEVLSDAKSALDRRIDLIQRAKKSVYLMTWAMYGDTAGELFADLLIRRFREGVDVRIIVDGQTAERIGYRESLEKLEAAGVPVVRYRTKKNPFFGQHRKFLLADVETGEGEAIAGGRNLGDVYLHTSPDPKAPKWRDTDIEYRGPAVRKNSIRFGQVWNEQMGALAAAHPEDSKKYQDLVLPSARTRTIQKTHGNLGRMAVIDHTPNAGGYDPIYLAILKAIYGARKTIDITNAYVISTPAFRDALVRAKSANPNLRIRVFTNSAKSVDEPVVSVPILTSVADLLDHGIEVYLKQGDTLHAKDLIVDGYLSAVMSYNLHPRSLRYEGETANFMLDQATANRLTLDLENDLKLAKRARTVEDLEIPKSKLAPIAEQFRDQL